MGPGLSLEKERNGQSKNRTFRFLYLTSVSTPNYSEGDPWFPIRKKETLCPKDLGMSGLHVFRGFHLVILITIHPVKMKVETVLRYLKWITLMSK